MAGTRRTVTVCQKGVVALEEPRVLFEADGKLYISVAVLEYDFKHPQITSEQAATIRDLRSHLDTGPKMNAAHFPSDRMGPEVIAANMAGPGRNPDSN